MRPQLLALLFLLSCFFPWIGPVRFGTDIQPYALALASLAILNLARFERFPKDLLWLAFPILISVVYSIDADFAFGALRSLGGYVGLLAIGTASYFTFNRMRESGFFYLSVLGIYLLAGVVQLTYDPEFFQYLLSREQASGGLGGRGVSSLAAEPTFLGIHAMFVTYLCVSSPYITVRQKLLALLLGAMIVFGVSRSTTAIASLLVIGLLNMPLVLTLLWNRTPSVSIGVLIGAALVVSGVVYLTWPEDSRFVQLMALLVESPFLAIATDQSVSDRVFHIAFSLLGFLDQPVWGHGFMSWAPYISNVQQKYDLALYVDPGDNRISSFIGGTLFEVGLFALPIFYLVWRAAVLNAQCRGVPVWSQISFIGVLLLQSVPVSYPLIALWLGRSFAFSNSHTESRLVVV